jgi:alkaline phosphatase D
MNRKNHTLTRTLTALLFLLVGCSLVLAKGKGNKKKDTFPFAPQKITQYKKHPRDRITDMHNNKDAAVIKYFEEFLELHGHDLEAYYGLALAYARIDKIDEAMGNLKLALKHGLSFDRFLAGPRTISNALTESKAFQDYAKKHGKELIHGPMLGSLSDKAVHFWLRTWHEVPVTILISENSAMNKAISITGSSSKERDYTAVLKCNALKADTDYYYQIILDGKKEAKTYQFKTMPKEGESTKFEIAFAGGAGFTPMYERMWTTVDQYKFRSLFLLGDNVYIDTPEVRATQQYCYYRRQSRPEFREITSYTSISAIWDDHDYYTNDGQGMNNAPDQKWKIPVLETFKNNWANPAYGLKGNPGCYFKQSIADVDFFFLDGRYYRYGNTMLGKTQKKWLLDGLKNSTATFKVLCSNVPITPGTKGGSKDTWDGYADERDQILDFVADYKIDGFFVIAADRHRSDAWKTESKKSYPIYEFQSSKFINMHTHPVLKGSLFGYNKKCSFGRLVFDTAAKDPTVRYEIINIDNEKQYEITLKKSQLSHELHSPTESGL